MGSTSLTGERDRLPTDRADLLRQALDAWRLNPLARRIVQLTSQYVVGGGISISCGHASTATFLQQFWQHRLNRMEVRCAEWCDELTRTGNLFILLSTDAAGMSYVRAIPAVELERIEARLNDLEQPLRFIPKATLEQADPPAWAAYDPLSDARGARGEFAAAMLHYAINRPVGAQWGESDLAPLLRWLARYANWLEDRVRINRFRTSFMYMVRARFSGEADRLARQRQLNAAPPTPGSILVADENESWQVISPSLEAGDAGLDGLALKKMIAAGAGVPLHFLAEPESATRTTAEAAGGPTYRNYEQRQRFFLWLLSDVLQAVLRRRAMVDASIQPEAGFGLRGADISARDNTDLAAACASMTSAMLSLREQGLVEDAELLRMVYRFAGESVNQ